MYSIPLTDTARHDVKRARVGHAQDIVYATKNVKCCAVAKKPIVIISGTATEGEGVEMTPCPDAR